MVSLVTAPLTIAQITIFLGLKIVSLSVQAWWHVVKSIFNFHVRVCVSMVGFSIALVTFPLRVLTALERERKLVRLVNEMQGNIDLVLYENELLKEKLQLAHKDSRAIESIFREIEDEYEKALSKIDFLENELDELKEQNRRLESQGKSLLDRKPHEDKYAKQQSSYEKPTTTNQENNDNQIVHNEKIAALYQSLFSSILSLIVGMIVWEAQNPCPPLVVALFFVVLMSLRSVVGFFSTIKNKPASDAVALLSVNWFILGTLTSPALPKVVYYLSPRVVRLANRVFGY
ncbi:hypothetical protein LUZ60_014153 [Juncus effusus]|nr:hypothetical protein LUZ60_014153 [Juncus effusus]